MAYEKLKESVWRANVDLAASGLVTLTWGNVSGADRNAGVMAIKPSGVTYDAITPEQMVVLAIDSGAVLDGTLRPSSDTATHLHLYREFAETGGVAHTHSVHAVSWAQAERDVPCFGTTHADHFSGPVPVTRRLRDEEIRDEYEHNTGVVIVECFRERGINPAEVPAALVAGHGPFVWGESPRKAVENAIALEATAQIALNTLRINAEATEIERGLLDKHFRRKHGKDAYYGQQR